MGTPIFVGSAFVAQYPEGGGNFWVPAQYVLGLRELGHEAYWLEHCWTQGDPAADQLAIATFFRHAAAVGVEDWTMLAHSPEQRRDDPPGRLEWYGRAAGRLPERRADGLLLNLAHSVTRPHREGFGRTVLFDLDPGTFQLWAREWDMGVGSHDAYLTIGMHLGAPDSPIPLGGVAWNRIWPAVHVASWPLQTVASAGRAYSTVTQWWSQQYAFLDGDEYDCNKRTAFMACLDVPQRAGVPVTLAANLHADETADRAALAQHGWSLVDPHQACGTPMAFRSFVQQARGEFSCAKPAYVKARAGWISDRTLCYLASGRPCVVEATSAERHLPASAGLRFFSAPAEAAEALVAMERDYPAAAAAARVLAEEVFSTRVVLPQLLARVGA
jgi:hypothetical protein